MDAVGRGDEQHAEREAERHAVEVEGIAGRMTSPVTALGTPAAASLRIMPGIAVSEDEVPITISSSSRRRRIMPNSRIRAQRQMAPSTTSAKKASVVQAVSTRKARAQIVDRPKRPTVNAIAPKAPTGAASTTMLTTANRRPLSRPARCAGARPAAHHQEADAGEYRDHQHLQDVALSEGPDERLGHDVHDVAHIDWTWALPYWATTPAACSREASATPLPGCTNSATTAPSAGRASSLPRNGWS